jgi:hypothetical protein
MTAKHTPATPLPYFTNGPRHLQAQGRLGDIRPRVIAQFTPRDEYQQDAAYIAHAANAYPKLVEALREACFQFTDRVKMMERHRALLRELGEE